ncbi:hypothetical protein HN784_00665 [bacterium]|jgi:cell fate regulator YaaT (PSP1 superfamily)|nr:hypothetical protein [bacterium]MBT4251591.1 hypothetical protein [bacterium]MBT4597640.1 hypothetical protein [bacterium]MBT6753653.1 hypothetical protein [bacterium]MBT7037790.1 hypothetical protein [bacterium]
MIIRFFDWDQPKNVTSASKGFQKDDKVVVEHEWGAFIADVLIVDKNVEGEDVAGKVIRKATSQDLEMTLNYKAREHEMLVEAKKETRSLEIPMKVIDVRISLDGSCAVIAFVADGRVDFRQLVKNLSSRYGKSIRLQQVGSRDEARRCGGYGICGRELCCRKMSGGLCSISTEMARCQFISHRGSDRISGLCGRLMCCLSYEAKQYQEMMKEMPQRGDIVNFSGKKGKVLEQMTLSEKLKVELEDRSIVFVSIEELKKK